VSKPGARKRVVSKKLAPRTKPRRPRVDARRIRNREALMRAAWDLAVEEGPAGLTPLRITERAGLHKRAFYAHFTDAGDCLRVIAQELGTIEVAQDTAAYREAMMATPPDDEAVCAALEAGLRGALEKKVSYRMMMQHRSDTGPLGRAVASLMAKVNEQWTDWLWGLALRYGVAAEHLREIERLAEQLVDYHFVVVRRLFDKPGESLAATAARMQRYNRAIVTSELRRMVGLLPIAGLDEMDRFRKS
jgi:AcrR family transcriptional regulator